MAAAGYLKRLTRRLTEDIDQLDAEDMEVQVQKAGANRACDCARGEEVTMRGELRSVQKATHDSNSGVIAEFFDGTDSVILKWIGRKSIAGILPGTQLTVTGRIGEIGGKKVIYNPVYELEGDA